MQNIGFKDSVLSVPQVVDDCMNSNVSDLMQRN